MRTRLKQNIADGKPSMAAVLANEGPRGRAELDPAAVNAFFGGTIRDYLKTAPGRELLTRLLAEPELFKPYIALLDRPGGVRLMARFLETPEGIDCFVALGRTDAGMKFLVEVGQTPEGRGVGRHILHSPIRGWPAAFRILRRLAEEKQSHCDDEITLPSFDLSRFVTLPEPARELLLLCRDPEKISAIFHSLSESDANAGLCCRVLADSEMRKVFFDYLTSNPSGTVGSFKNLFKSKERRRRVAGIFMSKGGTRLLTELAEDMSGRMMLASLAITPEGRNIGIKVLLYHPITVIRVGLNYFKESKTKTDGAASGN